MFGGSDLPSGVHGDVMGANPTTDEDKQRLIDEIKNRAKSILGSTRNYQEASALYSKGIEVLPNDAVLYGNRSMCHLSMKKTAAALEDANKAIELDSTYAKAYYRKAMAELEMGNLAASYDALQENLKLAPNDKAVQTQIAKVTSLRDKAGNSGAGNSSVPKARNTVTSGTSTRTLPPATPSDATPATIPKIPELPKPKAMGEDTVVENTIPGSAADMKGYKITADGKKTSYFNHDLDDKTKELIGDIRPKKIEVPAPVAVTPAAVTSSSAWNSAGTFEEKSVTPWAKECLESQLGAVDVHIPSVFPHPAAGSDGSARDVPLAHLDIFMSISKVKSVTGDASTVYNRGKKKYLYDFTVECEWKFQAYVHTDIVDGKPGAGASPMLTANGNITLNDITPDDDCDCTVTVSASKNNSTTISKSELTGLLSKYVRADGSFTSKTVLVDKLQVAAKKNIKQFDTEFKAKY
jgi:hypothetical protein